MLGTVIDLSNFDGFDLEPNAASSNIEISRINSSTLSLESKNTAINNYLVYLIPRLPVGAKVLFSCDTRAVAGDLMQMQIDSYSNGDYETGRVVEDVRDVDPRNEFIESKINTYVKPSQQYLRIAIGFYSTRAGIAELRSPKIIVEGADSSIVKPYLSNASFSRYWSPIELNREWSELISGTGLVLRDDDKVTLTADTASRSYIRYAANNTNVLKDINALQNVDTSQGFSVDVNMTVRAGTPAVFSEYKEVGSNATLLKRGIFLSEDGQWGKFYFPPIQGYDRVHIAVGFSTSNDGDCDIHGIKITQFGGSQKWTGAAVIPITATLRKDGGTWYLDNDAVTPPKHVFSSSAIVDLNINTSDIEMVFAENSVLGYKPTLIASVNNFGGTNAAKYTAAVSSISNSSADLTIIENATGNILDPYNVDDGIIIQVVGMGIK